MKPVAIFRHAATEGPGYFATFLSEHSIPMELFKIDEGVAVPQDAASFSGLVLMGGPMSVHDEDVHSFLLEEKQFVRRWVQEGNPTLGICLGAQLIADCLGARVYRGDKEELGWYEMTVTEEGKNDPVVRGFPQRFPVFQWHSETFDLPEGVILLARAQEYPHQAFRFGDLTYAFQYHLEVTEEMLHTWLYENGVGERKKKEMW